MPTYEEWGELINECSWLWTTQNGKKGYLVSSNTNGNSIFLPYSSYWSSSLCTDGPDGAWGVDFYSEGVDIRWYERDGYYRYYGFSVRAVSE